MQYLSISFRIIVSSAYTTAKRSAHLLSLCFPLTMHTCSLRLLQNIIPNLVAWNNSNLFSQFWRPKAWHQGVVGRATFPPEGPEEPMFLVSSSFQGRSASPTCELHQSNLLPSSYFFPLFWRSPLFCLCLVPLCLSLMRTHVIVFNPSLDNSK